MRGTTRAQFDRAQFLTRGARGGLALVTGGAVLSLAQGTAFGAVTADTDIAKLAATAELLAIDFYGQAIKSGKLKGVAAEIGACESRHPSVLTNIGAGAIVPAPDLPKVLTAAQATAAVTPFIA